MILKRVSYYLISICAVLVGLYPAIYFFIDRNFGLLNSKSETLLADFLWNTMFYIHIILGGIALLIGWLQFNKKIRNEKIKLHRSIGKLYVFSCLLSGLSGFYIALYATGGLSAKLGFASMALVWFFVTLFGFFAIKKGNVIKHQKLMIYSYAACFSAVTLRIWLPLLGNYFGEFLPAYRVVAWLSWLPNLLVAFLIIKYQFKITN